MHDTYKNYILFKDAVISSGNGIMGVLWYVEARKDDPKISDFKSINLNINDPNSENLKKMKEVEVIYNFLFWQFNEEFQLLFKQREESMKQTFIVSLGGKFTTSIEVEANTRAEASNLASDEIKKRLNGVVDYDIIDEVVD